MKTTLSINVVATCLLLASTPMVAHESNDDSCNIEMNGRIDFTNNILSVSLDEHHSVDFSADGSVNIHGQRIILNDAQQRDAQQYYQSIVTAIPLTAEIATDAVDIANTAVAEVFGELLGHDDDLTVEFAEFFEQLDAQIQHKFYAADGSFSINSVDLDEGQWIDQAWETEFEEKMESLLSQSMGRILIAVGTEMLWGDGDAGAFDARMENFGERIEQTVEGRSEALEIKAQTLCMTLSKADIAESRLAHSVPQLSQLNLFNIDSQNHM